MLFQEIETAKFTQQLQKSNPLIRKFAKNKPKIKQFLNKTSPKIATRKSPKKTQIQKKNKPKFAGRTQGWQHWCKGTFHARCFH